MSVGHVGVAGGFDPKSRRTDLLGLRGLFTVLIVIFHSWQWTHPGATPDARTGPVAVIAAQLHWSASWFFIVTAYLLARSFFANTLAGRPLQPAKRFMIRRLLRVAPAYWVVILIVWPARNPHFPADWHDLVEHLTFTQAFDTKRIFYTDGPTWSLTTEMFFYVALALLLVPFCRWLSTRSTRDRQLGLFVPGAALVLGGAAFGLGAVAAGIPDGQWATWFGPLAQGPALGAGLLLAACSAVLTRGSRTVALSLRSAWVVRAGGLVAVVLSATVPYSGASTSAGLDFAQRLVATLGFSLIVGGTVLAPNEGLWSRALSTPVLTYLGTISYSLYLWHEPVLLAVAHFGALPQVPDDFLRTIIVLVGAGTAVGSVAYHLIERPCLNLLTPLATGGFERYVVLPPDSLNPASYVGLKPAPAVGVLAGQPVPAAVTEWAPAPVSRPRRGHLLAPLVTAAAILTIVGGGVATVVRHGTPPPTSASQTVVAPVAVSPTLPAGPDQARTPSVARRAPKPLLTIVAGPKVLGSQPQITEAP